MTNDNTHHNFKGQLADEVVVCFTRKHWLVTTPLFVSLLAIIASPVVLAIFFDKASLIATLGNGGFFALASFFGVTVTYLLHLTFVRIFSYYLRIMIVTNHRIVDLKKTLFLRDKRSTVVLSEIQDISMDKAGIMQTLFNYGTISIMISGSTRPLELHRIPNPDYHFRKMIKSRQEYIAKLAGVQVQREPVVLPNEPMDAHPLILPSLSAL